MRSWKWYIHFPQDAYALGPVYFEKRDYTKPPNERDVRQYAREWEGVKRLPTGFSCWSAE